LSPSTPRVALLAEGLCGDLRPLCYGRSTWDVPFLGRPLLARTVEWLANHGWTHLYLLDDTPHLWLHELMRRCPSYGLDIQLIDVRGVHDPSHDAHVTYLPQLAAKVNRLFLVKPFALHEAHVDALEEFHEQAAAHATFALVRLDPSSLSWPYIPSTRMDITGRILDVEKLRRTDALGSANLDNVHKIGFTSRSREFWAPRNLAILDADLVASLPLSELVAPLAGLARSLAEKGVPCYGRALRGRWWSMSTPQAVMTANTEAAALLMETDREWLVQSVSQPLASLSAPASSTTSTDKMRKGRKKSTATAEAVATLAAPASNVHPRATVDEEVLLGPASTVEKGAQILGRCILGEGCVFEENAMLVSSVLGHDCRIEADACLEQSLLAHHSTVPSGATFKHAVMGSGEIQNIHRGVPPGGNFLDGLRTVSEAAVRNYWSKHAPVVGRIPICEKLETLAKGLDNNVYHIFDGARNWVIKRRLDCNAHPLLREFHVMRLLEGNGIAPRPYVVDLRPELELAPAIIMEYLPGKRFALGQIDADIAYRIGRTCAKVHAFPTNIILRDLPELAEAAYPDLRSYASDVMYQYHVYLDNRRKSGLDGDNLGRQLQQLLTFTSEFAERENENWNGSPPRVLCQGDLREFNMVLRDDTSDPNHGEVALLDWERCGIDDPAYDLAWFLTLAHLSPQAEDELRRGYGAGLPGDHSFWKRVEAYRIIDIITWPMHLIQIVQTYGERKNDGAAVAATYEKDAYEALAVALNARDGKHAGHSADSVRMLGPLFNSSSTTS
jgi:aminoglycoside phosphotransferase (APT) family kinase protein/NDP-sugar pyrophosphorylase family protein